MKGRRVINKAINWWGMKRPVAYSTEDHLNNPTANCCSLQENALAEAVADYISQKDINDAKTI